MNNKYYSSNRFDGFLYGKANNTGYNSKDVSKKGEYKGKNDEDLIIEDNTVYEIDRKCYRELMRKKNRKKR